MLCTVHDDQLLVIVLVQTSESLFSTAMCSMPREQGQDCRMLLTSCKVCGENMPCLQHARLLAAGLRAPDSWYDCTSTVHAKRANEIMI